MLTKDQVDELIHILDKQRERYCDALAKASDKTQPIFLERIAVVDSLIEWAMKSLEGKQDGNV